MGLVDKANNLDKFLNERFLEKEFTQERYDYYGADYDNQEINIETYIQAYKVSDDDIIEREMVFEEHQISAFKTALKELKTSFVEEYITAYVPLVEKIAFGSSLKQHLEVKLEKFRNNKIGRRYAGLLVDFINHLSIEFVDVIDTDNQINNSFSYSDKLFHRATISNLYKALIEYSLIGAETEEADFIRVFKNQEITKPVRWTGQTSELKYFIQIVNREDLGFKDTVSYKWQIAVKCFVKVSSKNLKKITFKDLRTYKVTPNTILKLDKILVNKIPSV